jgi:hypothetical protein
MALRNFFWGCDLNRTHPRKKFLKAKSRNFWYRARYTKIDFLLAQKTIVGTTSLRSFTLPSCTWMANYKIGDFIILGVRTPTKRKPNFCVNGKF